MFGLGRKKRMNPTEQRPLKKGAVPRTPSYIMAVSREGIGSREDWLERLRTSSLFQVVSYKAGDCLTVAVSYQGQDYEVDLFEEELELPELFTINHQFSQEDFAVMKAARSGLTSAMRFHEDALASYLVQLRVLASLVPDMVGLVDFCGERILSGVWARMAAQSEIPPSPRYLYSIQAVSGDDGQVWLHTHGLNRCGSIELEILDSDREHYQDHAAVLQTVAGNVITKEPLGEEKELFWISTLSGGQHLVGTWLDWPTAVRFYDKKLLGGASDRDDGHNENTGALFFYPSPEDYERKHFVPISAYNELLADNPIMMISTEETERMRKLARERLDWFRQEIDREGVTGLMKFGLAADEEYQREGSPNLEHIWFEVLSMEGDTVHCRCTQDAYYIGSLKEGVELDLDIAQLTDWTLYLPERQVTPDTVYLLSV